MSWIDLNYQFEEWNLQEHSRNPGDYLTSKFFEDFLNKGLFFQGMVFHFEKSKKSYRSSEEFDSSNQILVLDSLKKSMHSPSICLIKFKKSFKGYLIKELLEKYELGNKGSVMSSNIEILLSYPIEWRDFILIDKDEILLIIHHDGDPLMVLETI